MVEGAQRQQKPVECQDRSQPRNLRQTAATRIPAAEREPDQKVAEWLKALTCPVRARSDRGDERFGGFPRFVLGLANSQKMPIADISILSSLDEVYTLFSFDDICALSPFDDNYALSPLNDIGANMQIRTPLDLGLTIRDRRRKLKLSQNELARKVGVGRQWVVAIERGKSRAELGLALRALAALDLPLTIKPDPSRFPSSNETGAADIDAVVDAAKQDRT